MIALALAVGYPVSLVHAAPLYYDASNTSGLTAGSANWNTSGGLAWQTSTTPGTAAPIAWTNGETATFQTSSTNTVTVSGTVIAEGIAQTNSGGTGTTISGGTIQLGASGLSNSTNGSQTLTINSAINLATTATTFHADNSTSRFITLGGSVGEINTGSAITKTGAGVLTLNAVNTYTGITNISLGVIRVGVDNAINSASVVNFTGNTSGTKLEVRASTVTIAGLAGASNNLAVDTGSAVSSNTLIIDTPVSTSYTYGGALNNGSGTLNLVKNGLGTQTITKGNTNNTFSGTISVNNGVLAFGSTSSFGTGAVTINTLGTLAYNAGLSQTQLNRVTAGSAGTIALGADSNATLSFVGRDSLYLGSTGTFNYTASAANFTPGANGYLLGGGGGTLTIGTANMLTGSRALTVRGNVTLSTNQNYTGTTTVSSGTLLINGSLGNTTTTVNAGTLGGTGTIGGAVTIDSGAFLAPGASIESLGVASADINGSLVIEYDGAGAGTIDLLAVTGLLDIAGSTVDFNLFGTALDDPYYIFATYGSLTGTFGTVTDLPTGYGIQYAHLGNNIALVAIPESNVAALIGGFGVIALLRRKRR